MRRCHITAKFDRGRLNRYGGSRFIDRVNIGKKPQLDVAFCDVTRYDCCGFVLLTVPFSR